MGYSTIFSKEFIIRIGWRGEAVKLVSPCQRSCLLHNKIYKQDMQLTLLVHSENCHYRRRCRLRPCESQSRLILLLLSLRPKREMRFMIVAGTTSIRPASHPASPSSFSPICFLPPIDPPTSYPRLSPRQAGPT